MKIKNPHCSTKVKPVFGAHNCLRLMSGFRAWVKVSLRLRLRGLAVMSGVMVRNWLMHYI